MIRQFLGAVLLIVTFNYLFVADSDSHVKVGLVWLVVTVLVWWPDIAARLRWGK